jgi:hypothetical protein
VSVEDGRPRQDPMPEVPSYRPAYGVGFGPAGNPSRSANCHLREATAMREMREPERVRPARTAAAKSKLIVDSERRSRFTQITRAGTSMTDWTIGAWISPLPIHVLPSFIDRAADGADVGECRVPTIATLERAGPYSFILTDNFVPSVGY